MANTFFIEQNAFTTGEVSPAVGNRTDLDKYPYALAKAKNCFISPYGPVSKRTGTKFIADIGEAAILEKFIFTKEVVYLLVIKENNISIFLNDEKVTELETPFKKPYLRHMRFNQSNDVMIITDGVNVPKMLIRYSHNNWKLEDFKITRYPMANINSDKDNTLKASGLSGDIKLTATKDIFTENMIGTNIELIHDVEESIETLDKSGTTKSIYCEEFNITTGGFWKGIVSIDKSLDGKTWKRIRTYKGNEDINVKEGGALSVPCFIRMVADVKKGEKELTFNGSLRGKPRTAHGLVKINKVLNKREAECIVLVRIGSTEATDTWKKSYWEQGAYPRVSCFWQDRLWFTGRANNSNVIFGSKTSDYTNFSVERAGGDLTDDSACIFPLITKETFDVNWLIGGKDLIVLADGVEYRVDGDSVVTPKDFQASVQSSRGSNNCKCQYIGDQIIYVQRGGGTVREMGFSMERMSYVGDDLTIFVKHLTRGRRFIDSTYKQEPNSIVYFVRDDGIICCLSYIKEQQVFAWSTIETAGEFTSVASIPSDNEENVYCVVKRDGKYQVEKFTSFTDSKNIYDHVYMDSTVEKTNVYSDVITGLNQFKGKDVSVCFYEAADDDKELDNKWFKVLTVSDDGVLNLPCKVSRCKIGIPYMTEIETLNVEAKLQGVGTLQGKEKQIVSCVLRLENSYGGEIGQKRDYTFDIPYRNQELYTDDIRCDVGGERNLQGRLYIKHDDPVPFTLQSLVREVSV